MLDPAPTLHPARQAGKATGKPGKPGDPALGAAAKIKAAAMAVADAVKTKAGTTRTIRHSNWKTGDPAVGVAGGVAAKAKGKRITFTHTKSGSSLEPVRATGTVRMP